MSASQYLYKSKMDLYSRIRSYATLALLLTLSILVNQSTATNNITIPRQKSPTHVSWSRSNVRFDFVFNIEEPIKSLIKLDSDSNNFISNSLQQCTNYSACLFKNGTFLESFHVDNTKSHESIFTPVQDGPSNQTSQAETKCDNGNTFKIVHYCSTHWNPPAYLQRLDCSHRIEWHSPIRCHSDSVNHEHPCYIYDSEGKLIDLTPWIKSDGSSYDVNLDMANSSIIRDFRLNVCNEAHDACGPNVSACYVDTKTGLVESGYNNLTSIGYSKDRTVLLTSLGHYRKQCVGDRIKTVIRFTCKNKQSPKTRPKLIRATACENIIEWSSVAACPLSDVTVSAKECKINYEPLGIDIDIMGLTNNKTVVEVPNMNIEGESKKMVLGICKSLPRELLCEGKLVSTTQACIFDQKNAFTPEAANDSRVVSSILSSSIRLADDRIYLESFAINKTCSEIVRTGSNVTRRVGTRLEFFCSRDLQEVPTFLGYDDCIYVFEWGTPLMCLESPEAPSTIPVTLGEVKKDKKSVVVKDHVYLKNINVKDVLKSESRKKELTSQEEKANSMNSNINDLNAAQPSKMNSAHKYFMIGLIVVSFVAFIAVIFILDNKTRLQVTLRQARRVFQSNQQPYSRVVSDLDL